MSTLNVKQMFNDKPMWSVVSLSRPDSTWLFVLVDSIWTGASDSDKPMNTHCQIAIQINLINVPLPTAVIMTFSILCFTFSWIDHRHIMKMFFLRNVYNFHNGNKVYQTFAMFDLETDYFYLHDERVPNKRGHIKS